VHVSEIERYLDDIADRLGELGGTFEAGPSIEPVRDESFAILDAVIRFDDGSRLEIGIVASGPRNFPDWLDYSFHLMDAQNVCIFRYDNAPYHPGTVHFPHHKHVGEAETIVDHPRPSLAQVIDEVRRHVYKS
jgi:hypothetical protein